MAPLLEIRNLSLEIPVNDGLLRPIRSVDLTVERGETVAIVGESGCGKSLTSLAVMGLQPQNARLSAERLAFQGESLLGLDRRRWQAIRGKRIAMIFQDPMTAFDPCYRMGDQMAEILRQHRPVSRGEARERIVALLKRVGVPAPEDRLDQFPHQLSGGLRQRMMIATALLCEPELIIADEPTTALDVTIQAQILRLLADVQKETGVGLILVTHDIGVVAGLADRVVVMYGGEVVESGTTDEVLGSPRHPYTAGLMRSIPVPGRTRRGQPLGYIPGLVPRPIAPLTACGFLDRCEFRHEACAASPVPLRNAAGGRQLRCLLPIEAPRQPVAPLAAATAIA
ncbi:ABC transporter ATP-binding protein [Bosea sp. NPDC055332]